MDLPAASHKKIVDWWSKNSHNTNLYIGNGPYKIRNNSDRAWDRKKELPNQLKFARENKNVIGNVFFSAKSLMSNKEDVLRILKKKYYHKMALPPSPPLPINVFQNRIVETRFEEKEGILYFSIPPQERQNLRYALIYVAKKESKLNLENTDNLVSKIPLSESGNFSFDPSKFKGKKILALSFINNFGQESRPKIIRIN
jgi:hypothetical protein